MKMTRELKYGCYKFSIERRKGYGEYLPSRVESVNLMSTATNPFCFLRECIRSSQTVGAIWPSSARLARRIVTAAKVDSAENIVEIGPGSGVFTREILERKSKNAHFLALEKNPEFIPLLQNQFPETEIVEGCATRLDTYLKSHSMPEIQSMVSGLPWAIFPSSIQNTILDQIYASLSPLGIFTTFAYFGPHWVGRGRAFRQRLKSRFNNVSTTPIEMWNLPPAFVYIARK